MRNFNPAPTFRSGASPVPSRNKPWTVKNAKQQASSVPQSPRMVALSRRYDVQWMDEDGEIHSFVKVAPALPIFERAFGAFSHGALIATTEGPVAVEDLMPGMGIETADGVKTLRWVGAITLVPGKPSTEGEEQKLYRVTADALGFGRPTADVTFGPAARILNRDAEIRNALGTEAALAPVDSYEDGCSVVGINPITPMRVYHIVLDDHAVIRAGGVEVETYHPGPDAHYSMSQEMRAVFMSLFPHLSSLQDFGPVCWPRFEIDAYGDRALV